MMTRNDLPPPDGSSTEADDMVWLCLDCQEAKAYSKGDVFRKTPTCKNGHEMKLLQRADVV